MSTPASTLRLKPGEDRRLRQGHVWIFSNEVDVERTPLTQFEAGQSVSVENNNGKTVGRAYVNPHTLICARLYSRDPHAELNTEFFMRRFTSALALREQLFSAPFYRWVYSESDGVPGLVVDRYGDVLVLQINALGMERMKSEIVAALEHLVHPRAILLRNDSSARALEGLPESVEWAGTPGPELARIEENGARFDVPLLTGQKTGWFYDQRMNRARLPAYVRGKRVLDVFSYIGAWGVQAALAGATQVICVDSSEAALAQARHNAELNQVQQRLSTVHGHAFEVLKDLRAQREKFDVVIVDPPAFIKRKKDFKEGSSAYQRLNQMALQLVANEGILISCSCSYHLLREQLMEAILTAGRHVDRDIQILEAGQQGPDHPIHPAIPETAYLKSFIARGLMEKRA